MATIFDTEVGMATVWLGPQPMTEPSPLRPRLFPLEAEMAMMLVALAGVLVLPWITVPQVTGMPFSCRATACREPAAMPMTRPRPVGMFRTPPSGFPQLRSVPSDRRARAKPGPPSPNSASLQPPKPRAPGAAAMGRR